MEPRRDLMILPWAILLAACAVNPPRPPNNPAIDRCLERYAALDAAVAEYGATPASFTRIPEFPYLRVDRFLGSYRQQALSPSETTAWLARLSGLDRDARQIEWDSLPDPVRTTLKRRYPPTGEVPAVVEHCAATLRAIDLADAERLTLIRQRAQVSDDYHTVNQVLGLYPLTALPVGFGIYRFQEETRALFAQPLATLPIQGELRRFGLGATPSVPVNWLAVPRDALGIPEPTPTQIEALFTTHAPIWEIDVATDADRPGAPYWRADGLPTVNPAEPAVYRYVSYARWRGEPLLQLNYLIWFAARPRTGAFDLLGGPLDGVVMAGDAGSVGSSAAVRQHPRLRLLSPAFSRPSAATATGNGAMGRTAAGAATGTGSRLWRTTDPSAVLRQSRFAAGLCQPPRGGYTLGRARLHGAVCRSGGKRCPTQPVRVGRISRWQRTGRALVVMADGRTLSRRDARAWTPCHCFCRPTAFR
jgi:hypothetical protein